jgi:ABC-type transporter Mla subunit MlaD
MRRVLAIVGALAVVAAAAVASGAGGQDAPYRVRAIFDSAAFVVRGEDVKVAGVKVGEVDGLAVTPDHKAAVTLTIDEPGFQDFRRDATCRIRPQSLIGEQFVECAPTQPRPAGEAPPPPLEVIGDGDGEGERLLPVERTSTSVALDLLGNINRLPVRQRLTLIINELGVGLAGRGEDLNAVLRRSAPALQELDRVLDILASQNETLERLAVDSDAVLEPLARERREVTGFISSSARVAAATAERRADLEATLRRLPTFLAELGPTMRRLGDLARQGTPVAADLRASAADVNELIARLGPFSRQATPTLRSLGEVGERGIPAIRAALPITRDLRAFARQLRPVGATLADVLTTFRDNQGIPNALQLLYHTAVAINGFDGVSHFLRAGLLVNTCSNYAVDRQGECTANFPSASASASAAGAASAPRDDVLAKTAAVLAGATAAQAEAAVGGGRRTSTAGRATPRAEAVGGLEADGGAQEEGAPSSAPGTAAAPAGTATPAPAAPASPDTTEDVLAFLFGGDGP